ncbi:MAG: hypothetical protein QNL12_07125 [Acidimicrobiia bacterium]|nr:hypothetical protein [Acidimicrobiia bacterium]
MRVMAAFVSLLIVIPVLAMVILLSVDPYEPPADQPTDSIQLPVANGRPVAALPSRLALSWSDPDEVLSQGTPGTVTAVHIEAGSSITETTALFDVDGSTVIAVGPGTPLWRDLAIGDRGPDVEALARLLNAMGMVEGELEEPIDQIGPQLSEAIDTFLAAHEWPRVLRSSREGRGPIFPAHSTLFVAWDRLVIDDVNLTVGQPPPAEGEPILVVRSTVAGASAAVERTVDLIPDRIVFTSADGLLEVELDGDYVASPDALGMVELAVETARETVDGVITFTGEETPFVPVSAVVTGGAGQCVWGTEGAVDVVVVWSQGGRAYVASDADLPDLVITNPVASLVDPSC